MAHQGILKCLSDSSCVTEDNSFIGVIRASTTHAVMGISNISKRASFHGFEQTQKTMRT